MLLCCRTAWSQAAPDAVSTLTTRVKDLDDRLQAAKLELAAARKAALAQQANAALEISAPQLCIPRMRKPPVIDGVIDAEEWADAAVYPSCTGAGNIGQTMKAREASVYYLGWDDEHFYIAQRMPLREGETPVRLNRKPQHDSVDPWETEIELYIDHKSTGSIGSLCRWQFMANASGNQWDREDQYQIGQNNLAWDGDWQYKQRVTPDGKYWESEMAIPRTTVYQQQPLKDGDRWNIGFAASLSHPWQWSGFYGWPITATFREQAPSIRVFHPESGLLIKHLKFDMEVVNTMDRPLAATAVARLSDVNAPAGSKSSSRSRFPSTWRRGNGWPSTSMSRQIKRRRGRAMP